MKTMQTKWTASDQTGARPIGNGLSVLEFQDNKGEWHSFDVLKTATKVLFGGTCNVGFIESGYILRDFNNLEDTLADLLEDLQTYYNDGPQYVSRIVCNERM